MSNNKLLAALFAVTLATGATVSECISKDLYNTDNMSIDITKIKTK